MAVKVSARDRRTFNDTMKFALIGLPQAQYEVGLMYANGVGVAQDFEQALVWVRQAAERGLAAAQYLVGARHASGVGIEQDDFKALSWYLKAADQGYAKALLRIGKMHETSHPKLAYGCYVKAASVGLAEGQLAAGIALATGMGVGRDYPQAMQWCRKAAVQGLAGAQFALAEMYAHGQGAAPDPQQALDWYRKAAKQNFAAAQVALERLDANGEGRSRVRARLRRKPGAAERRTSAARWDKAAEVGDAAARYHLGVMYEEGLGVPQDAQQAEAWYLMAARQDDVFAQLALARLYEATQPQVALGWYQKAAEQGNAQAQFALGRLYCAGQAVERDFLLGVSWYIKAGERGNMPALMTLGHLLYGTTLEHMAVACFKNAAEQGDAEAQFLLGQHYAAGTGAQQNLQLAFDWWRRSARQDYVHAQCVLGSASSRNVFPTRTASSRDSTVSSRLTGRVPCCSRPGRATRRYLNCYCSSSTAPNFSPRSPFARPTWSMNSW